MGANGGVLFRVNIDAPAMNLQAYVHNHYPKTQEARLRIVDAILEAQRTLPHLEKIQELGQRLFGTHWQGESSNWSQLQEIVGYLSALHESVANGELPEALVTYLAANPDLETLQTLVSTVEKHQTNHPHLLQTVTEKIQLDETIRFGGDGGLKACPLTEQAHILECWEREAEKLPDIVTYNHLVEALRNSGFAEIVKIANDWPRGKPVFIGRTQTGLVWRTD